MRLIYPSPGHEVFARALAAASGCELGVLESRRFPDRETYVRLGTDPAGRVVDFVCSLADPDTAFVPLAIAADAARDLGASQVNLIAPYLGYMRQDARFHEGEAVSSRTFARLISGVFDGLVTVDPHLHRYAALAEIYAIPTRLVHAAPLMARWIRDNVEAPLIVGPDIESEQWAADVARQADAPYMVLRKQRRGDREVVIHIPDLADHRGRQPVLIDDIAASGRTLIAAAEELRRQGLAPPVCVVVHAIFAEDAYEALTRVAPRVVSTDAVPHPSNAIRLAPLVAAAMLDLA